MKIISRSKILASCCLLMAPSAAFSQLEEIVVTATLTERSLQDIPIAVSAYSAETMEAARVENISELAQLTPNFSFSALTGTGYSQASIRGVGAVGPSNTAISGSPAVTIYIDNVYMGSAGANIFSALDVERVEILRGPQGTLYGRNALGGVINFITAQPTDEFTGKFRLGYGNFNEVDVYGALSGPIIEDKLRARVSYSYRDRDGYVENVFDNPNPAQLESTNDANILNTRNWRATLDFTPTDELLIRLSAFNSEREGTFPAADVVEGFTPFLGYTGTPGRDKASFNENNVEQTVNQGGSLTIEWGRDDWRLVSITGADDNVLETISSELDSSPEEFFSQWLFTEDNGKSQELRFHLDTDNTESVFGAYYYEGAARQEDVNDFIGVYRTLGFLPPRDLALLGLGTQRSLFTTETESTAVFGNVDWTIDERWSLSLGARWTTSDRAIVRYFDARPEYAGVDYNGVVRIGDLPDNVTVIPNDSFSQASATFNEFTPRVSVQFRPSDDTMLYGSYSRGYRDGGFPTRGSQTRAFDPEYMDAFEVGLKTDLLDGKLRLNGAAYFYDYQDMQVEEQVLDVGQGIAVIEVLNAGNSEAYGFELEFTAVINDAFSLDGNLGFQKTEFKEFSLLGQDLSGNKFQYAPELTSLLAANYSWETASLGTVTLRGEWLYRDEQFTSPQNRALEQSDSYHNLNANLIWDVNPNWQLTLWVRHLTDDTYTLTKADAIGTGLGSLFGLPPGQGDFVVAAFNDPRTFGATVEYRFGAL